MNLDTRDGLYFYKSFLNKVKAITEQKNMELEVEDDKKKILLMCLYCDMLPRNIKVIQRTYPVDSIDFDDEPNLKEVGMNLHGTQVCVRDIETIDYSNTGIYSIASVPVPKKRKKKREISFQKE